MSRAPLLREINAPVNDTRLTMRRERVRAPLPVRVLMERYGLDDGRPWSLEEVGNAHGLSRAQVRRIEGRVLAKIGHVVRVGSVR